MVPREKIEVSVCTWNSNFQLGTMRIGKVVMDDLIHSRVLVHAFVQLNDSSFLRSLHMGATLVAKFQNMFCKN
jgi:hypothetical protein